MRKECAVCVSVQVTTQRNVGLRACVGLRVAKGDIIPCYIHLIQFKAKQTKVCSPQVQTPSSEGSSHNVATSGSATSSVAASTSSSHTVPLKSKLTVLSRTLKVETCFSNVETFEMRESSIENLEARSFQICKLEKKFK